MLLDCRAISGRGVLPSAKEGSPPGQCVLGDVVEGAGWVDLGNITTGVRDLRRSLVWGFAVKPREVHADACEIQ